MDQNKLRAWWSHRQGLDGTLSKAKPAEILERVGWARSVGGVNPYLVLFARAGIGREQADAAVANLEIHELPSARGCTYVLPASDYALGLKMAEWSGEDADFTRAKKHFGYTNRELDALMKKIEYALTDGPKNPKELKDTLGDAIRNFGEEGKKKGMTTSLPIALGFLQSKGTIRRISDNGRIDSQKYSYALWRPSPMENFGLSREEANEQLARRFFEWTGPASIKQFQWFSGFGVSAAKAPTLGLELVPIESGSELLALPKQKKEFEKFSAPKQPQYSLVAGIDNLFLLRRDLASHIDAKDADRQVIGEKGMRNMGGLQDLPSHAIVDRGRLIGLWEFDPSNGKIAWVSWVGRSRALEDCVAATEAFVRDELGDAKSFSLDSPASRAPRIAAIRA